MTDPNMPPTTGSGAPGQAPTTGAPQPPTSPDPAASGGTPPIVPPTTGGAPGGGGAPAEEEADLPTKVGEALGDIAEDFVRDIGAAGKMLVQRTATLMLMARASGDEKAIASLERSMRLSVELGRLRANAAAWRTFKLVLKSTTTLMAEAMTAR